MRSPQLELRFYETYYFANAIRNILSDPSVYLRNLDSFYGDDRHLIHSRPFPRFSAFHAFLWFVIDDLICDTEGVDIGKRQKMVQRFADLPQYLVPSPSALPVNEALAYYQIPHTSFEDWLREQGRSFQQADEDDISDYYNDLRTEGPMDTLTKRAVHEVFFVLFSNRRVLFWFNNMMAKQISDTEFDDVVPEYVGNFARSGVLRRVRIPSWVKRAVYFRDRGCCVACHRDLSGTLNISSNEHYDHIVPLAGGGLNDVTNIQLLCDECNRKKSGGEPLTSDLYEVWYEVESNETDD
jgi:hypothetical protein